MKLLCVRRGYVAHELEDAGVVGLDAEEDAREDELLELEVFGGEAEDGLGFFAGAGRGEDVFVDGGEVDEYFW